MSIVLAGAVDFAALEGVAAPNFIGASFSSLFSGGGGLIVYTLLFGGIGVFLYFIAGGFQFLMSRGDPKAVQQAQGKIANALIGFVIIFTAYWVVQLVGYIFGLSGITNLFS